LGTLSSLALKIETVCFSETLGFTTDFAQRHNPQEQYRNPHDSENLRFMPRHVVVEWLTPLLRILEVPGSNLDPGTGYSDWVSFGFPQFLHANFGIEP
jgi:hypothetical protein